MTETILTTSRLRVRNWCDTDIRAYNRECNTDAVMRYLDGVSSARDVRREVRWYQDQQGRHGHTFWVIERIRDSAFLGFCGIIHLAERQSPLNGQLEIGWRVRDKSWRRGYAYEAASAVFEWAEWELPLQWLYARVHRDNIASQRLARKLGMRRSRAIEALQTGFDRQLWVFRKRL